jgi:hypothetical protein
MSWSPFRFAYDNSVFWSDPTGLFESNGFETCPTCPNTPEFKPFIDDPDNEYVYDPKTNSVTPVIELNEATVTGKKKDSDNSEKALGLGLDVTESLGSRSSSILKDRFKYGEKYYNKPITIRTKLGPGINTNANTLKNLQKVGNMSGKIVKGLVVADVAMSGEIRASHVLIQYKLIEKIFIFNMNMDITYKAKLLVLYIYQCLHYLVLLMLRPIEVVIIYIVFIRKPMLPIGVQIISRNRKTNKGIYQIHHFFNSIENNLVLVVTMIRHIGLKKIILGLMNKTV